MQIHSVIQNTPPWLKLRATCDTASEAAAANGQSKHTRRSDLLKQKHTGLVEEVGTAKQSLFDKGHQAESEARVLAEAIVDTDLYPITGTLEVDGLNLLASMDGASMDGEIIWEHKLFSEKLAADVKAGTLEPHYTIQMDQQLLVSGAKKCLFMTSDGTADKMAWCWYESSPEKFAALIAGWKQFRADLATYTPVEAAPVAIGRAPETLPALHIVLKGEVSASNLDEFKQVALTAIRSVNRDLQTDQDFADSAKARKWCQDIEDRVAAAKDHALSQTATIDTLFRALDEVSAEAAAVRLALEKLEKARTQSLNEEVVADGKAQFAAHMTAHNAAMPAPYMPQIAVDFGATIKGLRTVASKRNAVGTELARVKIIADEHATRIQGNLKTLDANPAMAFLFSDKAQIVLKAADDLQALVANRIAEHERKEAARLEAEREKIRAEEQAKAEAAIARDVANGCGVVGIDSAIAAYRPAPLTAQDIAAGVVDAEIKHAPNVVPITRAAPAPQAAPATPPTLKLGEIGTRLGFSLTGDFLKTLGFEPAARDKSALLFHEASFSHICAALVAHINIVQAQRAA